MKSQQKTESHYQIHSDICPLGIYLYPLPVFFIWGLFLMINKYCWQKRNIFFWQKDSILFSIFFSHVIIYFWLVLVALQIYSNSISEICIKIVFNFHTYFNICTAYLKLLYHLEGVQDNSIPPTEWQDNSGLRQFSTRKITFL